LTEPFSQLRNKIPMNTRNILHSQNPIHTPFQKKLPMLMTWLRIVLVVPILALLFSPDPILRLLAALIFLVASFTDYLDGYFARKYQSESDLGKLMDPVADKILVSSVLVFLSYLTNVNPILVVLLLARDHLISGLRSAAAASGLVIAAKPAGKWKTALQMIAIPCIMIDENMMGLPITKVGTIALWISVGLSLSSGLQYVKAYTNSTK
jgi:CDP-diacylglycerol--glycerol-3-phosphate 3-phosphatidyltransferase